MEKGEISMCKELFTPLAGLAGIPFQTLLLGDLLYYSFKQPPDASISELVNVAARNCMSCLNGFSRQILSCSYSVPMREVVVEAIFPE